MARLMHKESIRSIMYKRYRVQTTGSAHDYPVAESFFKTFKSELVNHADFQTRAQARLATFEYTGGWDNRRRKHSSLSYQTPYKQESYFYTTSMVA
jgi:transposase InsO family protein